MQIRSNRVDRILGIGTLGALVLGCLVILLPFVTALLLAIILTYSTWPLYVRLRKAVRGRSTLAAGLMMLAACVILIAPFVFVAMSLADSASELVEVVRKAFENGPPALPGWITGLPFVGESINNYWTNIPEDGGRLLEDLKGLISPAK